MNGEPRTDIHPGNYSGGFRNPVFDAQGVFRIVLDALARPGTILPLDPRTKPPRELPPLAADILCALVDPDTSIFLCPSLARGAGAADWLRFQTGAPLVKTPAGADFAVAANPEDLPPLTQFGPGTSDYPDRSATVIVAVSGFADGMPVALSGPGIKERQPFSPNGVSAAVWQQLIANHGLYPRGIDVIFVSREAVAGLPRSTAIEIGEA